MQVSKNDSICGLAAPTARQLTGAYYDERPIEVACDILGIGQDAARDQMRAFETAGYIEWTKRARAAGDDWWVTTVKGTLIPPRARPGRREHGRPGAARRLPVAAAPEVRRSPMTWFTSAAGWTSRAGWPTGP